MSKKFSILAAILELLGEIRRSATKHSVCRGHRFWILSALVTGLLLAAVGCGSDPALEGNTAPPFTLVSANNSQVSLDQLLANKRAVVLVFYRGFF